MGKSWHGGKNSASWAIREELKEWGSWAELGGVEWNGAVWIGLGWIGRCVVCIFIIHAPSDVAMGWSRRGHGLATA